MIDSHCHLADEAFVADLPAVVARAQAAGVTEVLCILSADEADEITRAATVRQAWPGVSHAAAIHPHRAGSYAGRVAEAAVVTAKAAADVDAVAVGEIGLDYHYDYAPREVQRDVFAAQVALAGSLGLPVIVHTRDATDDTIAILRDAAPAVRGVMHCFSGTIDEARRALDLGFFISLSGIVTFPKAGPLREVAAFVPADRLLAETDAPFLAPVPHRGKRNEPAWVTETAEVLAATRKCTRSALEQTLAENFAAFVGRRPR